MIHSDIFEVASFCDSLDALVGSIAEWTVVNYL
jgi:hypothetical protein